jgi:prepilin-type N-terminal cleavage/methylation domain-containing protein
LEVQVNRRRPRQSGVTLLEMMIVVTLIALMVGVSFPAISAGLDTLRLRSASDSIVSAFNSAMTRADRRQVAVEFRIEKANNRLLFASAEPGYYREITLPDGVTIERVLPVIPNLDESLPRQYLIHPGGAVPRIGLEIKNRRNSKQLVMVDPISGTAQIIQ